MKATLSINASPIVRGSKSDCENRVDVELTKGRAYRAAFPAEIELTLAFATTARSGHAAIGTQRKFQVARQRPLRGSTTIALRGPNVRQ